MRLQLYRHYLILDIIESRLFSIFRKWASENTQRTQRKKQRSVSSVSSVVNLLCYTPSTQKKLKSHIESRKDSIDAMPKGQALLEQNRKFNRGGRRGTRRLIKTLAFLCAYSAVIFLERKHRIAIRIPISIL